MVAMIAMRCTSDWARVASATAKKIWPVLAVVRPDVASVMDCKAALASMTQR